MVYSAAMERSVTGVWSVQSRAADALHVVKGSILSGDGDPTPIVSRNGSGSGNSGTFSLTAGAHRFVFKLHEAGGADQLAVRFAHPDATDMTDLLYTLTDPVSPEVANTFPAEGTPGASRWGDVVITFSEAMDTAVDPSTVAAITGGAATGTWQWVGIDRLVWQPSAPLDGSTAYTFTIDAAKAVDPTGNRLSGTNELHFTTEPAPGPLSVTGVAPAAGGSGGVLASVNVTGTGFEEGAVTHPAGAELFAGHYYEYISAGADWHSARDDCIARGGHLVTISSAEENDFVYAMASSVNSWIGFTDAAAEGAWEWVSGEAVTYTNWNSGEPNNSSDEDYGVMRAGAGNWNDADPGAGIPYVCEYDTGTPPLVHLAKVGQPDILATNVRFVNAGELTFDIDLAGAAMGDWDIVVTNPGGATAALPGGFTVKPLASVAAVQAQADESGPVQGLLRIARTGDTALPLDVDFTVGGTAVSLADYTETLAAAETVTIPGGTDHVDITITPIADGESEGLESVTVTLSGAAEYVVDGAAASATVDILDADLPSGLVAWWKLDDGTGTVARDSSNGGHDGTLASMDPATDWVAGKVDGALEFDGNDQVVTFGDIDELDAPGVFTVSLWFNRNTDGTSATNHNVNNVLIAQCSNAVNDNLEIGTDGTVVELYVDSNGTENFACDAGIQDGTWYHLAITYDEASSEELALYIDGVLAQSWNSPSGALASSETSPLTLGLARPANEKWGDFDGLIDDVRIYDRALASNEVALLYYQSAGMPAIVVDPMSGLATSETGATATFRVRLSTAPADAVTVAVASSTPAEGAASPSVIGFDAGNWDIWQSVTVTGQNDDVVDGTVKYTVNLDPSPSADATYAALAPVDVALANLDDDIDASMIAWWKFDDGAGSVAWDSSNSGHHGALANMDPATDWVVGKVDGALEFDGTDAYVGVPDLGTMSEATVALWINLSSLPAENDSIIHTDNWATGSLHFQFRSGVRFDFAVHSCGNAPSATAFTSVDVGNWRHVAATYDSATGIVSYYLDGAPDGGYTGTVGIQLNLTGGGTGSSIGSYNTSRYYHGAYDDIRIYDRALSATEVHFLISSVPVVNAGADQTIYVPDYTATLIGTAVDDGLPVPATLSLLWEKVSGPGTVDFTSPDAAITVATFGSAGVYVLRLTADDTRDTASDEVTVTVWDLSLPTVSIAATDADAAEEGQDTGTFTVTRSIVDSSSLDVSYAVTGTATGGDYGETLTGLVTIQPDQATADIVITPVDDTLDEGTETLRITLATAADYNIDTANDTSSLIIRDNDVVIQQGLVGHWRLDEGSGATAHDTTPNLNHADIVGATWTAGVRDGALSFDGNDRGLAPAVGLPAPNDPLTLAFWVMAPSTPAGVACCFGLVDPGASSSVQFGYRNGTFGVWKYGGAWLVSTDPLPTGDWHHCAYTFDGTVHTLWLDGVQIATSTVTPNGAPATRVDIGSLNGINEFFEGSLDDLRIYDRPLSADEIRLLATSIPIVEAGGDQLLVWPGDDTATLDATVVDDGLPGPVTTLWEEVSGPGTVTFGDPGAVDTTATFTTSGIYVLRLSADDGANVTTDEVTITVYDPSLPDVSILKIADASEEGPAAGCFTVTRSIVDSSTLDVSYAVTGTAVDGDYAETLTSLVTIQPDQATADIVITPTDDSLDEGSETLAITIVTTADYNVDTTSDTATVLIQDNDILLAGGLVAYWRLDETSGTTALDSTGNGYDGALTNMAGDEWTGGKKGGALALDGSNDRIAIQNMSYASTGLPAVTVCAWIRTTNSGDQMLVSFDRSDYWRLEINGDGAGAGQVGWDVLTDAGQADLGGGTQVDDGAWHHVAGVYDAGAMAIYVDGVLDASRTSGTGFGSGATRYGYIGVGSEADVPGGATGPDSHFAGTVDEVRIYDRALSAGEVRLLATGVPGVDAGGDQTLTWPGEDTATLDGTAFDDGLPDPLAVLWEKVSGPDPVAFGDAGAVDTTATFPGAGTYVLRLTADDGLNQVSDEVAVTVIDPALATISVSATDDLAAEEGPDAGTFTITRAGSLTGTLEVGFLLGGSADATDYTEDLSAGTVTIPADQPSVDITITPVADGLDEYCETLTLTLVSRTTYNLSSASVTDDVYITDVLGDPDLIGLYPSAWPGRGRDRRCTGRSPYLGPQTNRVEWTYTMTWGFGYFAPVIGKDGVIYTGCWDDKFHAINPDGTRKWLYTGKGSLSPCVMADGKILWGAPGGRLVALNHEDGTEAWSLTVGGTPGLHLTPNIGMDGTIYLNLSDGNIIAVNPDGTEKWQFDTGASVESSVSIARDGTIYAGNSSGVFFAVNPDGSEKWRFVAGGSVGYGSAVGDDGAIYFPAGGYLYALDPDGAEKWTYYVAASRGPSIAPDGTIVVKSGSGSADGNGFIAINPDGTKRWHYANGSNILMRPAIRLLAPGFLPGHVIAQ